MRIMPWATNICADSFSLLNITHIHLDSTHTLDGDLRTHLRIIFSFWKESYYSS